MRIMISIGAKMPLLNFQTLVTATRLLSKYLCLQSLFPKDSVSLLFVYFTITLRYPHGGHWRKKFWKLGLEIAGKCISNTLSDCRSIVCKWLINMIFSMNISWEYHRFPVCLYLATFTQSPCCQILKKYLKSVYIGVNK